MAKITLEARWPGELAAGIRAGSETVTIEMAHTSQDCIDLEYWRECIRDYYDGAAVLTPEEWEAADITEQEPEDEGSDE